MGVPQRVSACPSSPYLLRLMFLSRYNTAFQLKKKQDEYCSKAMTGQWTGLGDFPEDLQWEALVDVLRGRVKVRESPHITSKKSVHDRDRRLTFTATKRSTWMTWFGYALPQ